MNIIIRPERPADGAAVRAVNEAAFETPAEADLVDALRSAAQPTVSLVAEHDGSVIGHILFTTVTMDPDDNDRVHAMALGPMAVSPTWHRRGVGSALVEAGLEQCRSLGTPAVFVLGHPWYYPRFGFEPAQQHGFRCRWDVPDDVFMVAVMQPDWRSGRGGFVRYPAAFDSV